MGGFVSLLIAGLTLSYAIGKWIELINRENPIITENELPNYYDANNKLDLA